MNKEDMEILQEYENRISNIEAYISKQDPNFLNKSQEFVESGDNNQQEVSQHNRSETRDTTKIITPMFTFNQIITFLGVFGIVIGIIFFYLYAVANNWISETLRVGAGVIVGFILFGVSYKLREKNIIWSNIVFGGSFFIEYLSVGFGTVFYEVLPTQLALLFITLFLSSSILLSVKFSSKEIAIFSLLGGFAVPLIVNRYDEVFLMSFYMLLSIALLVLSYYKNWPDIRFSTFMVFAFVISMFIATNTDKINDMLMPFTLFLIISFILYNIATMIEAIKSRGDNTIMDTILIIILPVYFLPILYFFLVVENSIISVQLFGIFTMLLSFIYLGIIAYYKNTNSPLSINFSYSLLVTGILFANIGLIFILEVLSIDYLLIPFIAQWALFSYMGGGKYDENNLYRIISYIFLTLMAIWYLFILRFDEGIVHASFFLLALALIPINYYILYKQNIDYVISGAGFIITTYLLIYSFSKYLIFLGLSSAITEVALSVLWLLYTLSMYIKIDDKNGKILVGTLLGITLTKIAFVDLFILDGVVRIIGFILFGILLLIGGYYLNNEKKN